jgi:hypothetical protein
MKWYGTFSVPSLFLCDNIHVLCQSTKLSQIECGVYDYIEINMTDSRTNGFGQVWEVSGLCI